MRTAMVNTSGGRPPQHLTQMTKIQTQAVKDEDLTQEERIWIAGEKEEQDIYKFFQKVGLVISGISLITGMYGQTVPEPSFDSQIEVPAQAK